MSIIEDLFNLLAPHQCLVCRSEGSLLCKKCAGTIIDIPPRCYGCGRRSEDFRTCSSCRRRSPLYSVWVVAGYEGAAKELVHALKFARAKSAAGVIAGVLAGGCALPDDVLITHVPTVPTRTRERGYDQAALIAKQLSASKGLPYLTLLARTGGQRQLGQSREVRKKQMTDAFRLANGTDLHGKHILLIDDVLTTGATCEAAARLLRAAGASRVSAAVFAVA